MSRPRRSQRIFSFGIDSMEDCLPKEDEKSPQLQESQKEAAVNAAGPDLTVNTREKKTTRRKERKAAVTPATGTPHPGADPWGDPAPADLVPPELHPAAASLLKLGTELSFTRLRQPAKSQPYYCGRVFRRLEAKDQAEMQKLGINYRKPLNVFGTDVDLNEYREVDPRETVGIIAEDDDDLATATSDLLASCTFTIIDHDHMDRLRQQQGPDLRQKAAEIDRKEALEGGGGQGESEWMDHLSFMDLLKRGKFQGSEGGWPAAGLASLGLASLSPSDSDRRKVELFSGSLMEAVRAKHTANIEAHLDLVTQLRFQQGHLLLFHLSECALKLIMEKLDEAATDLERLPLTLERVSLAVQLLQVLHLLISSCYPLRAVNKSPWTLYTLADRLMAGGVVQVLAGIQDCLQFPLYHANRSTINFLLAHTRLPQTLSCLLLPDRNPLANPHIAEGSIKLLLWISDYCGPASIQDRLSLLESLWELEDVQRHLTAPAAHALRALLALVQPQKGPALKPGGQQDGQTVGGGQDGVGGGQDGGRADDGPCARLSAKQNRQRRRQVLADLLRSYPSQPCSSPACQRVQQAGQAPFQACSNCLIARYCGPDCQRRHWRQGHRARCFGQPPPSQPGPAKSKT